MNQYKMKKSTDILSSEKSSEDLGNVFSFKRYFINNLDSYHGEYLLKEVSKVITEKNVASAPPSLTLIGEDAILEVPEPEQPYEIIGTVTNPNIKTLDNVARIVTKEECIPLMLTCGTVVLDISCDREELRIAMEYMKILKQLLEKQAPSPKTDQDDAAASNAIDGAGDFKKRYLILISTVMTWACTKPLDPDTPDMPFVETDFRKRKPHPNYKLHYDVENAVIGMARKYRSIIGDDEDTTPSEWVPVSGTEESPAADAYAGMSMSGLVRAAKSTTIITDNITAKRRCIRQESPQADTPAAQYPTPKGKGVGKKTKNK